MLLRRNRYTCPLSQKKIICPVENLMKESSHSKVEESLTLSKLSPNE